MPCEDCNGTGEVGDEIPQGEFQPPERERCESCDGTGRWVITDTVTQEKHDAAIALIQDAFEEDNEAEAAPSSSNVPAGWKLVPLEPTPDMMCAAWDHIPPVMDDITDGDFRQAYKDMVAAAPHATTLAKCTLRAALEDIASMAFNRWEEGARAGEIARAALASQLTDDTPHE